MEKAKFFFAFTVAFLLGIFVAAQVQSGHYFKGGFVFVFVFFLFKNFIFNYKNVGKTPLLLLALFFGGLRFWLVPVPEIIEGFRSGIFCVEEVDVRTDMVKYIVPFEDFRLLVNAPRYPVYDYGDCLFIEGNLFKPSRINDFAYDKYLERFFVYGIFDYPKIEKLPYRSGNFFLEKIFFLKKQIEKKLYKVFPEPHASFMAGLLLGVRRGIPDYLMDDFNKTGLTHIIAISGYNITLLIIVVGGIFGFLSRKKRVIFSSIFIFLFVILVGASASVVRAGIMGSIGLMALFFGRRYFATLSLVGAAFFMNLWNPKILLYDFGFQLSFLATCGLVYLAPILKKRFIFLPSFLAIRESFVLTVSAQIFALPVIIYHFGMVSLISPIANVFVLPFIPLAMIFGFLALTVSTLVFGFAGYLILEFIIVLVRFFAAFEFLHVKIKWFAWWMLVFYYFFLFIWLKNKKIDFV